MRRQEDLQKECQLRGISYLPSNSREEMMDLLAAFYYQTMPQDRAMLAQIEPMTALDFKDVSDDEKERMLKTGLFVMEPKMDGIRAEVHMGKTENRITSRRRSDRTYLFAEKTDNFPHIQKAIGDGFWAGTVFDNEFMMKMGVKVDTGAVVTEGTLTATTVMSNSGPDKAIALQEKYGYVDAYVFDLLFLKGKDIRGIAFGQRRMYLEKFLIKLAETNPDLASKLKLVPQYKVTSLAEATKIKEMFESQGYEGAMIKNIMSTYESRRCAAMYKWKKGVEIDAFISGSTPGRHGFDGLVGSLLFSVYDEKGVEVEIGGASPGSLEFRKSITSAEGPVVKSEYIGKVVTLLAQEFTKTKRLRHCRILSMEDKTPLFREDKGKDDCRMNFSGEFPVAI